MSFECCVCSCPPLLRAWKPRGKEQPCWQHNQLAGSSAAAMLGEHKQLQQHNQWEQDWTSLSKEAYQLHMRTHNNFVHWFQEVYCKAYPRQVADGVMDPWQDVPCTMQGVEELQN